MSRVGNKPIAMPEGVRIDIKKTTVTVNGPKGTLSTEVNPAIKVEQKDGELKVSRPNDSKLHKSMHGLYRTLIGNMIEGVTQGFEKKLEIVGVGYKAEFKNQRLVLQIGYSHPIVFVPPDGIDISLEGQNNINISGMDKELVGKVAAKIRSFRPPEPYKGKGIKYLDEYVRRKAGKTAA